MNARRTLGLTAALALAAGSVQAQTAHQELVSLAQDVVYTTASVYPMSATFLGIPGHDGELEAPSESFRAAHVQVDLLVTEVECCRAHRARFRPQIQAPSVEVTGGLDGAHSQYQMVEANNHGLVSRRFKAASRAA